MPVTPSIIAAVALTLLKVRRSMLFDCMKAIHFVFNANSYLLDPVSVTLTVSSLWRL